MTPVRLHLPLRGRPDIFGPPSLRDAEKKAPFFFESVYGKDIRTRLYNMHLAIAENECRGRSFRCVAVSYGCRSRAARLKGWGCSRDLSFFCYGLISRFTRILALGGEGGGGSSLRYSARTLLVLFNKDVFDRS